MMTGTFGIAFRGWEIILGGIVVAALMIWAARRKSIGMLLMGTGLTMAGVIANRWNTTMLAFAHPLATETDPQLTIPAFVQYTPSAVEWATAIGIVAGLTLVFSLGMRFFPAYRGSQPVPASPLPTPQPEATSQPVGEVSHAV